MLLTLLANNQLNGAKLRGPVYNAAPRVALPGDIIAPPLALQDQPPLQNPSLDAVPPRRYTDFDIPQQAAFAAVVVQPQPFLNVYFDGPVPQRWPNGDNLNPPDLIAAVITNTFDSLPGKVWNETPQTQAAAYQPLSVLVQEQPDNARQKTLIPDYDIPQQAAFLPIVVVAPPPPLNPYPESKPNPARYPWEPMQETTYLPPKTLTGRSWDTTQGFRTKVWNGDIPLPSAIYLPTGGPTPPPTPTPAGRHRRHYVVRDGNRLLLFANKADADLYRRRLQRAAKPATERRRLRVLVKEPEFVIDLPKTRTLAERHGQLGTFLEAASAKRGFVELVKIQSHLIAMEAARMREEEEIAIALLML